MISLKNWFRSTPTPRDGLTQAQREAIVDLLNYCSFVDHDIADNEEVVIDSLESQLDWDHQTNFDYYVNKSIGVVRGVIESKDEATFLQLLSQRLDSKPSRQLAVSLCQKLISADGRTTAEESDTLAAVRKALA